jgi:hypothetical protein
LIGRGDPGAAEPLVRRVLTTRTARLGESDPRTAEARVWLGACLVRMKRESEGVPLLTAGYERLQNEPYFRPEAQEASRLLATLAEEGRTQSRR